MSLSVAEQLTYSTVRIECVNAQGIGSTGTGFFFTFFDANNVQIPVIVTNKHVVEGSVRGKIYLTKADSENNPVSNEHLPIIIDDFRDKWVFHDDEQIDLCIMPFGPLINYFHRQGKRVFYSTLTKDLIPNENDFAELDAIEDITMIGYPSGIWDEVNNLPVVRRGITASHPVINYNGKEEILIDAACYPGSSGSPVFIYNNGMYTAKTGSTYAGRIRVLLLGVLYAGPQYSANGDILMKVPIQNRPFVRSDIPMNLGYVIKSHKILDFEEIALSNV